MVTPARVTSHALALTTLGYGNAVDLDAVSVDLEVRHDETVALDTGELFGNSSHNATLLQLLYFAALDLDFVQGPPLQLGRNR